MKDQYPQRIWLLMAIVALTTASVFDYPKIKQPELAEPLVDLVTLYIAWTK
ncbi:MAG: hypothetical protein KME25_08315 [Symplocastrum torsivum CPER-KK1]|jgi:hypothetical protein|uniref:Uncharacterized protein n=1 Tax=Symplocastrum torsivum CPER-KK1 TaxID=450513 RepID=A0A951PIX5_9CYAN|nr:hypothetical protein [Symplocastrum torsivum CPER-KK1]